MKVGISRELEGLRENAFCGGAMDIFSNYTIRKNTALYRNFILRIKLKAIILMCTCTWLY